MLSQQSLQQNKYKIVIIIAVILVIFHILGLFSNGREVKTLRRCRDRLPFGYQNINHNQYYTWYGKKGTSTYGYTFQTGHVFSRHVAVNSRCTSQQIMNHKTVFINQSQLQRILYDDNIMCDLTSSNVFTFDGYRTIKDSAKYINGIDCFSQTPQQFNKYFIQYKKAVQNPKPTQSHYMASLDFTIWTFYPTR